MFSGEIDPPVDQRPISNFSSLALKLANWINQVQQGHDCGERTTHRIGTGYLSPGQIFGLQGSKYFPNPDALETTWYKNSLKPVNDNDFSVLAKLKRQIATYMEPHVRKDTDLTFKKSFSYDSK